MKPERLTIIPPHARRMYAVLMDIIKAVETNDSVKAVLSGDLYIQATGAVQACEQHVRRAWKVRQGTIKIKKPRVRGEAKNAPNFLPKKG